MRKAVLGVAVCLFCAAFSGQAAAASDTNLQLFIQPAVCTVDVVQDGGGQVVQTPEQCKPLIPDLLTPTLDDQRAPFFSLPFAGDESTDVVARQSPDTAILHPVATVEQASPILQQDAGAAAALVAGIGAATVATALALDVAVFEMHYSKTAVRWTKQLSANKLLRKK